MQRQCKHASSGARDNAKRTVDDHKKNVQFFCRSNFCDAQPGIQRRPCSRSRGRGDLPRRVAGIEKESGGRLGVAVLDTVIVEGGDTPIDRDEVRRALRGRTGDEINDRPPGAIAPRRQRVRLLSRRVAAKHADQYNENKAAHKAS